MTTQHTLLVVHSAPPVSKRDRNLANRIRRYFHPGNVLRSWAHSASFYNWLAGVARGEDTRTPIAMVITTGTFTEIEAQVRNALRSRRLAMPGHFQWMVASWEDLERVMGETRDGDPLRLEPHSGIEFRPLPVPTGQYNGYTISGPFGRKASAEPGVQSVYGLRWSPEQERYFGSKVSGFGPRHLWWEEGDVVDMVRLGYLRHHAPIRIAIERIGDGQNYDVTNADIADAFYSVRDRGLMTYDDLKIVLAGIGVRSLREVTQAFVRYNILAFLRSVIGGVEVRKRLRVLFGLPHFGHRNALFCTPEQRLAISLFDDKDIKADTHNAPLPGYVRLRVLDWVEKAEPVAEPYVDDTAYDNTSWNRVVREHMGAHFTIREIQWDLSWNPITKIYEAQRSDGREIAHLKPTDLRNMIAVGKLVPFAVGTTPYPDLDTFNNVVMGHPRDRRLERNGVIRKHVKGFDDDKLGTGDVPSNKRKAIMDDLKYHLKRYERWAGEAKPKFSVTDKTSPSPAELAERILAFMVEAAGISYDELTKPIPGTEDLYDPDDVKIAFSPSAGVRWWRHGIQSDFYAAMAQQMRAAITDPNVDITERKIGMPPELGMDYAPYTSARETILGKEGAQAQRDEAAKRAAEAKAAAFPVTVHAGTITVRGEEKRLVARVSRVTQGVITATMAGTNTWRKGQDNTHLALIRNAQIDRTHFGYEKYGVTLDRDDLTLAQLDQHAFEEGLDLVCYLRARIRAMNKISGNGAEYGPDEEWIEPLVRDAHALLEGLARQVLRTNPEANKLSQYVELEESFSDAGKNRLFEDLKAGKVPMVTDVPFTGGVYTGTGVSGVFGERGPEMVIPKSEADRLEEKTKNFAAAYSAGSVNIVHNISYPGVVSAEEAARLVDAYRSRHPDVYQYWSTHRLFTDDEIKATGLLGDKTENRGAFWVTKEEAEYLDAQPDGWPGISQNLHWYRNIRTTSHAEAMARSKPTLTKDEPMDPNDTLKYTSTAYGTTGSKDAINRMHNNRHTTRAPQAGVMFGSQYGAADTISGFSTESLLHVLRVKETAARDFFWAFHQLSKNGGWWNDLKTGEPLVRNRGEMLCLVHSEISEAMEGERKNRNDDHLPERKQAEVELADAQIRIADYSSGFGYDVIGAMVEKAAYNAQRADHKPENRAAEGGKQF